MVFRPLGRVKLQGRTSGTEIFELCGYSDRTVLAYDAQEWASIIESVESADINGARHKLRAFRERHTDDLPAQRLDELCRQVIEEGIQPVFTPGK
jgi:hypothetical protein